MGIIIPQASKPDELINWSSSQPIEDDGQGDWFDAKHYLGKRGHRYFTPATKYLLAASGEAVNSANLGDESYTDSEKTVVIGTNFSEVPIRRELDEIILSEGSRGLSPMTAPNSSVNIPASQVAIRFGCRAPNITLTNPLVAGIEALVVARDLVNQGRARFAVAGATEGSVLVESVENRPENRTQEGSCVFTLETRTEARARGSEYQAQLLGGTNRYFPPTCLDDENAKAEMRALLTADLQQLLSEIPINRTVTFCFVGEETTMNNFVRFIGSQAKNIVESEGRKYASIDGLGMNAEFMTVSPMLQLAVLLEQKLDGVVVAISPFGHIAMIGLSHSTPDNNN